MPTFNFVIRDGVQSDVPTCIALDHHYTTEHVWQMTFQNEGGGYRMNFRVERLPREVESVYPVPEERLEAACKNGGLLVAVGKEGTDVLGYITLRYDSFNQVATIRDIVVTRSLRHYGVGARLFSVARRWAQEKGAHHLIAEVQNKNYPAIQFCQRFGLEFCGFNDKYFPEHDIALFFSQSL